MWVACPLTRVSCPSGDNIPLFSQLYWPSVRNPTVQSCLLEALTVQLFYYGFITWLTAQDTLLPILLAKKTYSFWRLHFDCFVYLVPQMCCLLLSSHPFPPFTLDSQQIPFCVVCRYTPLWYCYRFFVIFLSY